MKKRITLLATLVLVFVLFVGCGNNNDDMYTIGIAQFAEHGSLDNCREGIILGLEESGLVEGEDFKIKYENAQADGPISNQISTNFVANKVDLIAAIATPMAQSAYSAARDTDIPIIYSAVTDPVLAEIASEDKMPVGNITGTSDKLPIKEQLEMIRGILPDAKSIGIMFSTSEVNSISAIKEYKELATNYGFDIVDLGIAATSDIPLAADSLLEQVDVISNLTDNTVVSSLPLLLDKAKEKGIPVFGSEIEQVKIGSLAAMGIDYIELGIQTGKMAAQVLKGEKEASDMAYEVFTNPSLYINTQVAEELGITIPEELVGTAKEVFTVIEEPAN